MRLYTQCIGMEFDIEKCTLLIMRNRKRYMRVGIELQNQKNIVNSLVLKNIGSGHCQTRWKKKLKKEYLRITRKLYETNLNSRNFIKWVNAWAIPPSKIFGTILEVNEGRTSTNEAENKKVHDDTSGLSSQRWRSVKE